MYQSDSSRKTVAVLVILTEFIIGNWLNRYWRTKKPKMIPKEQSSNCRMLPSAVPWGNRKSVGFL